MTHHLFIEGEREGARVGDERWSDRPRMIHDRPNTDRAVLDPRAECNRGINRIVLLDGGKDTDVFGDHDDADSGSLRHNIANLGEACQGRDAGDPDDGNGPCMSDQTDIAEVLEAAIPTSIRVVGGDNNRPDLPSQDQERGQ